MKTLNKKIKKNVTLICFGALLSTFGSAWAESDMQLQEKALKARELIRRGEMGDHAEHANHTENADPTLGYRGVFYGYLPCDQKDCDGLKMTMSLKQKNNYLIVSQYAKSSSREYFEKGKYVWDEKTKTVSLTPNNDAPKRVFKIEDQAALVLLNSDGSVPTRNKDDYTLTRNDSDKSKTREVHIH
jgi:hypothetical protein